MKNWRRIKLRWNRLKHFNIQLFKIIFWIDWILHLFLQLLTLFEIQYERKFLYECSLHWEVLFIQFRAKMVRNVRSLFSNFSWWSQRVWIARESSVFAWYYTHRFFFISQVKICTSGKRDFRRSRRSNKMRPRI